MENSFALRDTKITSSQCSYESWEHLVADDVWKL